jgi:hypothetical protein
MDKDPFSQLTRITGFNPSFTIILLLNLLTFLSEIKMSGTLTQTDVSFTFNWKIPKFLESPDKYIVSPEFSVCDSKNTTGKCVLKVYPKGEKDSKDHVALELKNISTEEKILCFTLCIIDRGGKKREIISTP